MVGISSIVLQNLQISFSNFANLMFALLKKKKIFSKNRILLRLFQSKNIVKAMSQMFKSKQSIFQALILVFCIVRPNFTIQARIFLLILLPKVIKIWISFFWNCIRYQMQGISYKVSKLIIINIEFVRTAASFLAWKNSQSDCFSYYRYNK